VNESFPNFEFSGNVNGGKSVKLSFAFSVLFLL